MADEDDKPTEFTFPCEHVAAAFGSMLGEQFLDLMGAIYDVLEAAEKTETLPTKLGMALGNLEALTWAAPHPHEVQAWVEHARAQAEPHAGPEPASPPAKRSRLH